MLTDEQKAIMDAVAAVYNRRLEELEKRLQPRVRDITINGRDPPAPQVYNDVRTPEVYVSNEVEAPVVNVAPLDMTPVANAVDRFADVMDHHTEMLGQLVTMVAALAQQTPTVVNQMPEQPQPAITFRPEIRVERPAANGRRSRSFVITHGDGTESRITEE